jgi:glucosamine--fructose-6-phosphate aminotransferase (isomerizing)
MSEDELRSVERIHILACGTSWHSGLVGKFMIEELARVPVEVDYGSEYRYRKPIVNGKALAVGISQSGETADTLSAMEAARDAGAHLFTVCNVQGSQATRISEGIIYTHAGPEIGVASTKAFTTQLVALYLLALYLRQLRTGKLEHKYLDDLARLPQAVDEVIRRQEKNMEALARRYFRAENFLYLGRGINYPIALEGALKLKEISYIHAEGYAGGEMKHGPIALIDEKMPVVVIAPKQPHVAYEKIIGNIEEVRARGGKVIAIIDEDDAHVASLADHVVRIPAASALLAPVVATIPLQLLAYHVADLRGNDVDQPRNLAKSVTVE